jgi:ATP/maltotriose-dependent transcriptional regulator MalT/DNA-binding SARP family transcriptional activator
MKARAPAKITEPLADQVYPRRRLWKRLDAARHRSVVWLVGPPGAGKTMLLASYLRTRGLPFLWYRVDPGDVDATNLFHYLGLAASTRNKRASPLPRWTSGSPETLAPFARRYFEELCKGLPPRAVIVFDDAHEAKEGSPWNEALREGLFAIPRDVRVLIASRSEPPAPFARRIASGEVEILEWSDLRLTPSEARGLADVRTKSWKPALRRDVLPRLLALADGWAAGLVLLLGHVTAGGTGPEDLAGPASQQVFDYLASELFERLDADTQRFLLETAFLTTMSERAAAEHAGPAARRILARLHRQDFFVERHGTAVYRYHPLFRAFLLDKATERFGGTGLRDARRKAGAILLESGQAEDAFALFRQAGDDAAVVALIRREARRIVAEGRHRTLEPWIDSLPEGTVAADGWLSLWRGVCALSHAPSRSAVAFGNAFNILSSGGDPIGTRIAWAGAVHAIVLEGNEFSPLDAWLARLDPRWVEDDPSVPPDVALRVATAHLVALQSRRPGGADTRLAAERAVELTRRASDLTERLTTLASAVVHHVIYEGDVARAACVLDMLRAVRAEHEGDATARILTHVAEAAYTWLRGENATCVAAVVEGLEIGRVAGIDVFDERLCAIGIDGAHGVGDLETARRLLTRMGSNAEKGGRFVMGSYHLHLASDAHLRGDAEAAARSVAAVLELADTLDFPLARAVSRKVAAVVACADGRVDEAARHLREARAIAEQTGMRLMLYDCLLTEADQAVSVGRPDARALLERGLAIGREAGYFATLRSPPGMVARIAARALTEGIEVEYVTDLVKKHRLRPEGPPADLERWPWPLRIRALGCFELLVDGAAVESGGKSQKTPLRLLRAVIARGGRSVAKSWLVHAVWPDAEGDAAPRLFDVALYRLRKLLGRADVVRLSDGRVHLDAALAWTDVWALEDLLARVDRAVRVAKGDAAALLERVLALYGGPLFASDDEPWAVSAREQLHGRFVGVVVRVGGALESEGNVESAARLYERALEADDMTEAFYVRLMACNVRLDRRTEALRVLERFRRVTGPLGVQPSAEMRALARQCRP